MFQKIRNHIALAAIFFVLIIAQQYAFYGLKGFPIIWLTFGKYLGIFFFLFILTFSSAPKLRLILLSSFLFLNFFQMVHLSYFGTQILPTEISLLFSELHEITGVLKAEMSHIFIPLFLTLIPSMIGIYSARRIRTSYSFKIIPILAIAYFMYNPIRTYVTGNTWGRQPSTRELGGMNVYLSASYFLGKILPYKLRSKTFSSQENQALNLKLKGKKKSDWDNIIIVLGESLTPHHMSLFGYERPTTVFLNSLKKSTNFFQTIGLSSGVSTDISIAFFLNMGYGDAGGIKAAKGEHCLFKLAKQNEFKTHFLSSQSSQQLRYIAPYLCSAYLDDFRSLEDVSPQTIEDDAAIDRDLLPHLEAIVSKGSGHFIILHQRGSHGPWALRFTDEAKRFNSSDVDQRINDYDNSVVEYDLFWRGLDQILSKTKTRNLVIYLSDHGESIGKNQRWGHGFLDPTSFEIPILIQSYNQALPHRTQQLPNNLPQYNLSLFLVNQMGYETSQDSHSMLKDFVIYGNDIDGFAGKAEISFTDLNKYEFKIIP